MADEPTEISDFYWLNARHMFTGSLSPIVWCQRFTVARVGKMFRISGKKRLFCLAIHRSVHITQRSAYVDAKKTHQDLLRLQNVRLGSSFRMMCTTTPEREKWKIVYEGPISRPVKLVKMLSLTTAVATFIASPLMIFFGKHGGSLSVKVVLVALFCSVGGGSTALLHWLTKPYVHRMYFDPERKRFAVETLSLFAVRKRTEFSADDILVYPDDRAFSTFEANGVRYFIHKELVEAQQVLYFIEREQL